MKTREREAGSEGGKRAGLYAEYRWGGVPGGSLHVAVTDSALCASETLDFISQGEGSTRFTHGWMEACLATRRPSGGSVGTNVSESKDERLVFSNSTNWRSLWQDYL